LATSARVRPACCSPRACDNPAQQRLWQHERRHELEGLELGAAERAGEQPKGHAEQRVEYGDHHQRRD
jgi:hypothetical protein